MKLDRRLLALARPQRAWLLATVAAGYAGGLAAIWQARLLSRVIARVFLEGADGAGVAGLLALLLALCLARAALAAGGEAAGGQLASRIKAGLRVRLFDRLQALGPTQWRQPSGAPGHTQDHAGELINALTEGVEALEAYFSQYLLQLALAALLPLTILAVVLPLDALSAAVFALTAPLIPFFMALIGEAANALTRRQWTALSRMSAHFLDVLQGLATLKAFGRSREQEGAIAHIGERFRQATMGVLRVAFLSALVLELAATLSTAVVAVEIGLRLLYGRIAFEQALFVLLLAPEFYQPLRLLGSRFHAGVAGLAAGERLFQILAAHAGEGSGRPSEGASLRPSPAGCSASAGGGRPSPPGLRPAGIAFENVRFTYPGDRPALDGVTFEIPAGKTLALAGESGAGKSTLAGLLLGFLQPQAGRITVDGVPLSSIPLEEWRARLAWVPQNPYLFADTVAANIRLARPAASLEEVVAAARLANADEFIHQLPQGYETHIGERGNRLSAGQAQRIALARAFLKDAPFLVLDEPTAFLDAETEARLQEAIRRLSAGRTTLLIAHSPRAPALAEAVALLENGRLAWAGAPGDLPAAPGPSPGLREAQPFGEAPAHLPAPQAAPLLPRSEVLQAASPPASGRESPPGPPVTRRAALLRLLSLLAPYKTRLLLSTLLGFATVASGIGLMAVSAYLISAAALHPSIAALQVPIVGVRFFGLCRGVFRYLERCLSHDVTFRALARLRTWFYRAIEPLAPARLGLHHSGDLLARAVSDVASLENFYGRAVAPPLVALLTALLAGVILAPFAPAAAALLLALLIAAGVGLPLAVHALSRASGSRLVRQRAALNVALLDGIQGLADLQAYGAHSRQLARISRLSWEVAAAQARLAWVGGLQGGATSLLTGLGAWSILLLAIPLVRAGSLEGIGLASLVLGAMASFEAVIPLPQAAQHLESCLVAARRLFSLVEASPPVLEPPRPWPLPPSFALEARQLRFSYPAEPPEQEAGEERPQPRGGRPPVERARAAPALDGISFSLPPGKKLAIVGPNGAGKTTLVHLLLRFWDYEQGQLLLGGRELRGYRPEDARTAFAVVSQPIHLFNATLRENLLLARPSATSEEMIQATKAAQLHDFIASLPEGYETWIGEHGLRLSGGQRQRLAVARALLKDAPILVLDEPTANLDRANARRLLQAVLHGREERAVLLVTHLLDGLEAMDEILVLQGGRVIERGRHEELLRSGGLYRRMWEAQNQGISEAVC